MNMRGHVRVVIFLVAAMIMTAVYLMDPRHLYDLTSYEDGVDDMRQVRSSEAVPDPVGYLVYNPKCRIPDMDAWDKSVRRYFRSRSLLSCSKKPLLTSVEGTGNGMWALRISQNVIPMYKENRGDALACCYSEITRIEESPDHYDSEADTKFRYSECHPFKDNDVLPKGTEFIRVKCILKRKRKPDKEVYRDGHSLVPIVPTAAIKMSQTMGLAKTRSFKGKPNRLNVMIIGIDSVSRLNLKRTMPQTLKHLKRQQWIELRGYTKIADNTFPNLMAILAGRQVSEIRHLCFFNRSKSMNNCPFLWQDFGDSGYVTAYAEDTPTISTFNYHKVGFVQKPTDYYLRPFMLALHSSLTKRKLFGLPVCVGPVAAVDHVLNYARRFLQTFNRSNHFSLFWMNSLSHNDPTATRNMDDRIRSLLDDIGKIGAYDNTVFILLSDHGTRFGQSRHSFVGYYEDRLPFVFVWFPKWFRERFPAVYGNLVTNQGRLTCPFDLHLTLVDILNEQYGDGEGKTLTACPKCLSLFREVPWERGCEDAAIDDGWCMCHPFNWVKPREGVSRRLGAFITDTVNNATRHYMELEGLNETLCATWHLAKVVRVHEMVPLGVTDAAAMTTTTHKLRGGARFLVLVELSPGQTRFESMIEVTTNDRGEEVFTSVSSPSRLDGYSKFAKCVTAPSMKYYCHCVDS